ncbi:MAG TPA: hypothetical protein VFP22_11150, partial [Candidatus Limnocylindrales bacterium]|nr:hypothetical protein [Candidatus Limnocylindrales bacterium]
MVRRFGHIGLALVAVLLLAAGPVAAQPSAPRPSGGPKVVIIVGPAGPATASYHVLADQAAAAAEKLTANVVRVYSPDATWERVKAALEGASMVVYLGHGNGWPSIYHDTLVPATEDGFGLNPEAGVADAHQYFGESRIAAEVHLAPNAVVIFSHLCYASGNSEPGLPEGTLDVAQQRVDNYAAGFLKAGAGAVIADAYLAPQYYVTSVLAGRGTIDGIWRSAPNRNGHFLTFPSARTRGAVAWMDPAQPDSGFIRSMVARPNLTAAQVIFGSARRPGDVPPTAEPTLASAGVTFGAPALGGTPTAGTTTTLRLPVAPDAAGLLPARLLVSARWDRLDDPGAGTDPTASAGPAASPAPGATAVPTPTAATSDGGVAVRPAAVATPAQPPAASPTAALASPASDGPAVSAPPSSVPDLVVPEVAGEVVAPVAATRLVTGGWSVRVKVPSAPGLYRLVAMLHQADGLAYDAATQALVPALVVRVVGPSTALYRVAATAAATAAQPLVLSVDVANLGTTPWGRPPGPRDFGPAEIVQGAHATLVAHWVPLGAAAQAASGAIDGAAPLPAGMKPGTTVSV